MGAAHRDGRVVAPQNAGDHWVEIAILGLLVRFEVDREELVGSPHVGHCLTGIDVELAESIGSDAQQFDLGPQVDVLGAELLGDQRAGLVEAPFAAAGP